MTLWPLSAQVHRTVSPTEMLTVSGTNDIATLPHRHIDNRAGSRWHAAHGWPAVLIENADGETRYLFLLHRRAFVARFSLRQKYDRKHRCQCKKSAVILRLIVS